MRSIETQARPSDHNAHIPVIAPHAACILDSTSIYPGSQEQNQCVVPVPYKARNVYNMRFTDRHDNDLVYTRHDRLSG